MPPAADAASAPQPPARWAVVACPVPSQKHAVLAVTMRRTWWLCPESRSTRVWCLGIGVFRGGWHCVFAGCEALGGRGCRLPLSDRAWESSGQGCSRGTRGSGTLGPGGASGRGEDPGCGGVSKMQFVPLSFPGQGVSALLGWCLIAKHPSLSWEDFIGLKLQR